MLKLSGYSENYRRNTVNGVMMRFDTVLAEVSEGKRKFQRTRQTIETQKSARGGNNSGNWFLKGLITSTLSVPISEDSKLKSNIQTALKSVRGPDGGSTMILEQAGKKIVHTVPQPSFSTGCYHQDKCLVAPDKKCGGNRLVYKALCKDCPESSGSKPQYIGTTGYTLHSRSGSHLKEILSSKAANSLHKHNKKLKPESMKETQRFEFHPVSSHPKSTERLLTEAYLIQNISNTMNSKKEYGHGKWISVNFCSQPT